MTSTQVPGLVSIITPAYNSAGYIAQTLASVQSQTYGQWEWIVVDDASTDSTAAIVKAAAGADPRIRLVRLDHNFGQAAHGRNVGMGLARGEFIAFLDADDLWESPKLQVQLDYLRDHPDVTGVCTWYDLFGYGPAVRATCRIMNPNPQVTRADVLRGLPMQTSTVLFRRSVWDQMGGMDEDPRLRVGEDHDYFGRMIFRYTLHRITRVLAHYRLSPPHTSLTTIHQPATVVKTLNVIEIFREKGLITPRERRWMRARNYYSQAADNLMVHHAPFRRLLVRSVLAGPPPARAVVMLLLSFLPAALLRPLLGRLQAMARGRRMARGEAGAGTNPRTRTGDPHA